MRELHNTSVKAEINPEFSRRKFFVLSATSVGLAVLTSCTDNNNPKVEESTSSLVVPSTDTTTTTSPNSIIKGAEIIDARAEIMASSQEEIDLIKFYTIGLANTVKDQYNAGIGTDNGITASEPYENLQIVNVVNRVKGGIYKLQAEFSKEGYPDSPQDVINNGLPERVTIVISDNKDQPTEFYSVQAGGSDNVYSVIFSPTGNDSFDTLPQILERMSLLANMSADSLPFKD